MKLTNGYIVGLIDGEGTINMTKYEEDRIRPQILIFNTYKEVLDQIKREMSLTAPVLEVSRVGDNLDRQKDCYRLQVRSKQDIRKMFELFDSHPPIIKNEEYKEVLEKSRDWVYS